MSAGSWARIWSLLITMYYPARPRFTGEIAVNSWSVEPMHGFYHRDSQSVTPVRHHRV